MSKDIIRVTKIIGKFVQSYEYEHIEELAVNKNRHRKFGLTDILPDEATDRAFERDSEWGGIDGCFEITVKFIPNKVGE